MSVNEVAQGLIELCRKGENAEAIARYYSPNIVSTEPFGETPTVQGVDAVHGKMEWWNSNFEVHGTEVIGPFVHGSQFIVEFNIDTTNKQTGERTPMHETALYTVADGKIVDEKFFYKV